MHIEHDYGLGGFASTANLLRFLRYVTDVLDQPMRAATYIVLDDINTQGNHDNYTKLLEDPRYFLVDHDLNRQNGYAIFERASCKDADVESASASSILDVESNGLRAI